MSKFFLISGTLCGYLIFTMGCCTTQMNVHLWLAEGENICIRINKEFSKPLTFCGSSPEMFPASLYFPKE